MTTTFRKFCVDHPHSQPCVIEAPNEGAAIEYFLAIRGMFSYDGLPSVVETDAPADETEAAFRQLISDPNRWAALYDHHTWKEKLPEH